MSTSNQDEVKHQDEIIRQLRAQNIFLRRSVTGKLARIRGILQEVLRIITQSQADNEEEDEWFVVDRVTRRRFRQGRWEYLTHWKQSWIHVSNEYYSNEHVSEVISRSDQLRLVKWRPTWVPSSNFR